MHHRETIMLMRLTIIAIFLGILVSAPLQASPGHNHDVPSDVVTPFGVIDREYGDGEISTDQMALLIIKAIKRPSQLPDRYQTYDLKAAQSATRRPSMALLDIIDVWDELSDSVQFAYKEAFVRPEPELSFVSPGGYFKLHYDTATVDSVPLADEDSSGVPDFVESCAAYLDTTLNVHLQLGWEYPPSDGTMGGDSLYDIYYSEMEYYGYTVPEGGGPEPWNDYYSHIILNSSFEGFPPNMDPEGPVKGAAKVTCAHEFHHAVQYAYDAGEDRWFQEMDAVHFEDIVFDQTNDNYNYLPDFMDAPQKSLMENTFHYYSTFLFPLYLAQQFDTSLMLAAWQGARGQTVFNALKDTISIRYGWTVDSAFSDFTTWNYITAGRDDGLHHEEAEWYPYVDIGASHNSYPVVSQISPVSPAGYGSCYIEFYPGSSNGIFRLTFNGDNGREWDAYLIKSTTVTEHEIVPISLDSANQMGTIDVYNFEEFTKLTLVAANVSEFSTGASFSYSVEVLKPYDVTSQLLTTDTVIYSGNLRYFWYEITNPSTLNDVFDVFFQDDFNWGAVDSTAVAISAGMSDTLYLAVSPPVGTPLGETSNLYFSARSRGDTSKSHQQQSKVITVLQRGDVNFDGLTNISDLTYLVAYLFAGGATPDPTITAADFNCVTPVNIQDLTAMVAYLFQSGADCPCNPY
ncbi:hypothetical protein GF356_04930 [candidate division GN15 bacterium]|nr:hypothetical protein [candidate division GN15 bacterium]